MGRLRPRRAGNPQEVRRAYPNAAARVQRSAGDVRAFDPADRRPGLRRSGPDRHRLAAGRCRRWRPSGRCVRPASAPMSPPTARNGWPGFNDESIATYPGAVWLAGIIKDSSGDYAGKKADWGVFRLPAVRRGGLHVANLGGSVLVIPAQCQNKDAAWAFIEYALCTHGGAARPVPADEPVPRLPARAGLSCDGRAGPLLRRPARRPALRDRCDQDTDAQPDRFLGGGDRLSEPGPEPLGGDGNGGRLPVRRAGAETPSPAGPAHSLPLWSLRRNLYDCILGMSHEAVLPLAGRSLAAIATFTCSSRRSSCCLLSSACTRSCSLYISAL